MDFQYKVCQCHFRSVNTAEDVNENLDQTIAHIITFAFHI